MPTGNFASDLIVYRSSRRWTQRQLANALDVPERTVQRWEAGRAPHTLLIVGVWATLERREPAKGLPSDREGRAPLLKPGHKTL